MQAQVGLLDERVSRLEQSSVSSQMPIGYGETLGQVTVPTTPATIAKAPSGKPATRDVQRALKAAGFYQGALDGKRGPATQQAIQEFQRMNGLKVDGKVGPQTWAKLTSYLDGASSGSSDASTIPLK
ncbi:MAG: peptidoglycan-binding protein [Candidatus Omnitrophica bacterium]|nr:peptidoglycan-binding protein [Candidatus Omnitrophota bacterium]